MKSVEDMKKSRKIYKIYIKRSLDVALSLLMMIILSPVFLIVAILVRIRLGTPIIFRQERPGLHEKVFHMYKFRTMTDAKDETGQLLPDAMRLTSFGKALRSTSLDELPELWNILKGDMSIVGPRPLLVKYLPLYNERQKLRHNVRPGFTGLAQVNGRNRISWRERLEWDVKYVERVTFLQDCKIILKTIKIVLKQEGISSATSATMEEFMGNER